MEEILETRFPFRKDHKSIRSRVVPGLYGDKRRTLRRFGAHLRLVTVLFSWMSEIAEDGEVDVGPVEEPEWLEEVGEEQVVQHEVRSLIVLFFIGFSVGRDLKQ